MLVPEAARRGAYFTLTHTTQPEPWLRGTLPEVPAVIRAVLHALELAREDVHRWCKDLVESDLINRPYDLPSLTFQLNHIAGSLDRLLTYAEGRQLSDNQLEALKRESELPGTRQKLFQDFETALNHGQQRVRAFAGMDMEQTRSVGRKSLPTSLGGLLVHIADHTQRHVGQVISTAKLIKAINEGHRTL